MTSLRVPARATAFCRRWRSLVSVAVFSVTFAAAPAADPFRVDPLFAPMITSVKDIGSVSLFALGDRGIVVSGSIFAVGDKAVDGGGLCLMRSDGSVERVDLPHGPPRFLLQDGSWLSAGTEAVPGSSPVRHYLRLYHADGTLDPLFRLDLPEATWTDAARAPGGKIVLSNQARDAQLAFRPPVERYNPDGSRDTTFACAITDAVKKIAIDPQGRVLTYASTTRPDTAIRLLDTNGAVDTSFGPIELRHGTLDRLAAMPDGSWLALGRVVALNSTTNNGYARILANGTVAANYSGLPGSSDTVLDARLLADGRLVLLGRYTGSGGGVSVVSVPADGGAPQITRHELMTGLSGHPLAGAIASDGSCLVAGEIFALGGNTSPPTRQLAGLARFLADGSLDEGFAGTLGRAGTVRKVQVLPDGRTLVAGGFDGVNGVVMPGVAILMPDGSLDASFMPRMASPGTVIDAVGLADGSVVLSGNFPDPLSPGSAGVAIVRLRSDGTRDTAFDRHFPYDFMSATSIGVTHDGRLLVSRHSALDTRTATPRITRFHTDASIDTGFDVRIPAPSGASFQAHLDGSILVRGQTTVTDADGATRSGWVRIAADGRFVTGFSAPEASASYGLFTGPGGHLFAAGAFTSIGGVPRSTIARLNNDGSVDTSYSSNAPSLSVLGIAVDGSVVFATGSQDNRYLGRLDPSGNVDPEFDVRVLGYINYDVRVGSASAGGAIVVGGDFTRLGAATRTSIARLGSNAPLFTLTPRQPSVVSTSAGAATTLGITVSGAPAPSYRWQRQEGSGTWIDIPGALDASYVIPSTQQYHGVNYRVIVTAAGASVTSEPFTVQVSPAPASDARLLNLSTRALCQTGDSVLIPGFYIHGSGTKRMLMRAVGPELTRFGLHPDTVLPDPQMVLRRQSGNTVVASNDNWNDNANWQEIRDTTSALHAFSLTAGSKSAALLMDLPAGGYTITSSGHGAETGVSIVELYEANGEAEAARLINISNRGFVGVGGNIMIPGFYVSEQGSRTFLIRAVGPTLAGTPYNVSGTLADPVLRIFRGNDHILTSDNWGENGDAAQVRATASAVSAFGLREGSKDAAFVVTLSPGGYTVQASGKDGATGVALVEVYLVP